MAKKVINIIKLCVGAQNVTELYNWQKNRIFSVANLEDPVTFIITRMRPKKEVELLNGGSIYWVFKGLILARQKIIGFDNIIGADNILRCKIILNSQIILTESIQKRPFQGWRYFKQEEVPNDREIYSEDKIEIPLGKLSQELLNRTIDEFGEDADMSNVALTYEKLTGTKIRP